MANCTAQWSLRLRPLYTRLSRSLSDCHHGCNEIWIWSACRAARHGGNHSTSLSGFLAIWLPARFAVEIAFSNVASLDACSRPTDWLGGETEGSTSAAGNVQVVGTGWRGRAEGGCGVEGKL